MNSYNSSLNENLCQLNGECKIEIVENEVQLTDQIKIEIDDSLNIPLNGEKTNTPVVPDSLYSIAVPNNYEKESTKLFQSECDYHTSLKNLQTFKQTYHCINCKFKCERKSVLLSHVRRHNVNKVFQCSKCDFTTPQKDGLIMHKNTHTVDKPFQCNYCNFKTTALEYLQKHKRRKHASEERFHCPHCQLKFVHSGELRRHKKSKHTRVKSYQCTECDFKEEYMIGHKVTHICKLPRWNWKFD